MEPRFTAVGTNGQIELYETFIMLSRKNLSGGRFIFLHALSGVEFRLPNVHAGFMKLLVPGIDEIHEKSILTVDFDASVTFGTKEMADFKTLLDMLLQSVKPR
jgi:hypothetical protein